MIPVGLYTKNCRSCFFECKESLRDFLLAIWYFGREVIHMRDIGKNIRDLRTSQKMTQDQLAEKLYVSRQTLSNYETGRTRPDIDMLLAIAEQLDTSLDTILYGISYRNAMRKHRNRMIVCFVITIGLFFLYSFIGSYANGFSSRTYKVTKLFFLNISVIRPIACMMLGWSLCYAFAMISRIRCQIKCHQKGIFAAVICVLLLYSILIFPYLVDLNFTIPILWQKTFFRVIGLSGTLSVINSSTCAFFLGILLKALDNKTCELSNQQS